MASEQLSRRDNVEAEDRETRVEKDRVPQLTSHFEAMVVHGKAEERERREMGTENERERQARVDKERSGNMVKEKKAEEEREEHERQKKGSHAAAEKVSEQAQSHQRERERREMGRREEAGEAREKRMGIGRKEEGSEQQNQPSLDEISKYRGIAQEKSNEAIRGAAERYEKAKESLNKGVGAETEHSKHRGTEDKDTAKETGQTGLGVVKETLTSAAQTAKDYTMPIAEKAKDFTVQKAVEAKDITVSAGETAVHYLGEKAVAAKNVAVEGGKTSAEYAGKAAEDLKDKAVVAGWSTAHYSCDTAVEGTKAAARLVKGAAEYAGAIAGKPLSTVKNVAESTGESVKDYTARKKEAAARESMSKKAERESMYYKTKETFEGGREEVQEVGEEDHKKEGERTEGGGVLGAIGETIYEIAQTTKDIVIGDETGKQSSLGFGIGGGEEGEPKDQEYENQGYHEASRKEHRA